MPAAPHSGRSRRWIGFFVVLAVLAVFAIIVPLAFNLFIQLRSDHLIEAQKRWQENAMPNYDLEYLVKTTHGNEEEERAYLVQVRGGQVVLIVCDSDVVYLYPSIALVAGLGVPALSSNDPRQFGIPALFAEIERTMRQDELSGRRNFASAQFDPKDGHPFHYVHRVRGTKERIEWNIKFSPR
jgi:hypothetical protein